MAPIQVKPPPPPPPPPPPVLTDQLRALALDEQATHCAPSTWQTFLRSLRARGYPLNVDPRIT